MIYEKIDELLSYGIITRLIEERDEIYVKNRILALLKLDSYEKTEAKCESVDELEEILDSLTDYAVGNGLIENDSIVYRDMFDTALMDLLTPYPSTIINKFNSLYDISPEEATDYFYTLSCDSNYIRRYRIKKDVKWTVDSEYGEIEITINRSKPEKDPKAIAAAKNSKESAYPLCQLCIDNEGYEGRLNHPARRLCQEKCVSFFELDIRFLVLSMRGYPLIDKIGVRLRQPQILCKVFTKPPR